MIGPSHLSRERVYSLRTCRHWLGTDRANLHELCRDKMKSLQGYAGLHFPIQRGVVNHMHEFPTQEEAREGGLLPNEAEPLDHLLLSADLHASRHGGARIFGERLASLGSTFTTGCNCLLPAPENRSMGHPS